MYERLTAPWPEDIKPFPELDDPERIEREINTWFEPYLFYRRKSRGKYMELWTSCCGRHERRSALERTMSAADAELMSIRHNAAVVCPYCGRKVLAKCLGSSGKRQGLTVYRRVVILQERDGDIFARAYWVRKDYEIEAGLNGPPLFYLVGAYRFTAGNARYYAHFYDKARFHYAELAGRYDPREREIREPFANGNGLYTQYEPYAVIGIEELDKSRFRYCEYAAYRTPRENIWGEKRIELHSSLMKYLAVCSIYPRAAEMLMKTGWWHIVYDMVEGRRKNAAAFDWDSPAGGAAAFGLTKQEYRALINSACRNPDVIGEYKRMRKAGVCRDINAVIGLRRADACADLADIRRACTVLRVTPEALLKYIQKQGARVQQQNISLARVLNWTLDYWDMAAQLGWSLADSTVLWPRDIKAKHDTAAEELTAKRRREAEAAEAAKITAAEERLSAWRLKYNIELDGYFIRIAESPGEIITEGATLKHCVAGYAQRHMDGQCTILFLRRCAEPCASLYTIEMRQNRLVQIHGYRNEVMDGKRAPDPRETMAWMLDPWLDWIQRGSPRDKEGAPIIKTNKEAKTA